MPSIPPAQNGRGQSRLVPQPLWPRPLTYSYNDIFFILPFESPKPIASSARLSCSEHRPETETEHILVDRMAQHHWLRNRAEAFESGCFKEDGTLDDKRLALFMRYRTSHERAFTSASPSC